MFKLQLGEKMSEAQYKQWCEECLHAELEKRMIGFPTLDRINEIIAEVSKATNAKIIEVSQWYWENNDLLYVAFIEAYLNDVEECHSKAYLRIELLPIPSFSVIFTKGEWEDVLSDPV
jgi:hypothetical protein